MKLAHIKILVYGTIISYLMLLLENASVIDLARVLGLMSLAYLWWQIVLGFRGTARFFTKDLVSLNSIHQTLGKYGFLLLLTHFALIVGSNAYSLIIVTSLDLSSEFIVHVKFGSIALTLAVIVWLSSALLRKKISWDWWKRIHLLAYVIFFFAILHSNELGTLLNSNAFLRFLWIFQVFSFLFIVIGRIAAWIGIGKKEYVVEEISDVARNTREYVLRPKNRKNILTPIKGQFVYFQYKQYAQSHPFTISRYIKDTGEICVTIKQSGDYTQSLFSKLEIGATVYLDGPYGMFTQNIDEKPAILIAGGIGITPFLQHLDNNNVKHLFWGCDTYEDIAHKDMVMKSKTPTSIYLGSEDRKGYIKGRISIQAIKHRLDQDLSSFNFFICGPPAMMRDLKDQLISVSVPNDQIFIEEFSL